MTNLKIVGSVAAAFLFSLVSAGPSLDHPGAAGKPAYRIDGGEIVLESPFDLEIGSVEYAKAFGDLIQTSAHATYDPRTKATTTNFFHHAQARLAKPYFGSDAVSLSFKGEEKSLESMHFSIGEWNVGASDVLPSYSKCREVVGKVVADMNERLGLTLRCTSDHTEKEAKELIQEHVERIKRERGGRFYGCASSFVNYTGTKMANGTRVDYSVCGMLSDKGKCSINISCSRYRNFALHTSYKPGDAIPVYTNEMYSATAGRLVPTKEQEAAHNEARKLRETVNRLFGIDFDNPSTTNELSSALWQTNVQEAAKREWIPLGKPFEGMTECRANQSIRFLAIPFGTFALRRPYDGDVAEDELKEQARRFLDRLEREYGARIPEGDTAEGKHLLSKMYGDGVPTFGDTKALLGQDKTQYFIGKVGDLAIDVSYAKPLYEKRDDGFKLVRRGAVVVNVIQSPIITKGKVK